jgi:hypothetical protein
VRGKATTDRQHAIAARISLAIGGGERQGDVLVAMMMVLGQAAGWAAFSLREDVTAADAQIDAVASDAKAYARKHWGSYEVLN